MSRAGWQDQKARELKLFQDLNARSAKIGGKTNRRGQCQKFSQDLNVRHKMRYTLPMQKGRFAPSPSGRMHLGNIYAALISWLSVKKEGGAWLLRVEDLDRQRCKREYADQLMDDLRWLGLEWDNDQNEGRAENGGAARPNNAPCFQSERDGVYQKYFSALEERGLVYDCFCRRADLLASSAPHANNAPPVYAGTCRALSQEERARLLTERKPAKRLRVDARQSTFIDGHYGEQKCDLERDCGDFILRRADDNFSYNLAVTVDDALMGVTQVARGRDLLASTHQQIFLYEMLGFKPPRFFHFPLLVDKEGRRLSKRDKDLDMGVLRANNAPQKIIGKLMRLCGFVDRDDALELSDALELFDWDRLPKSDIVIS